jgi:hypothetical protein
MLKYKFRHSGGNFQNGLKSLSRCASVLFMVRFNKEDILQNKTCSKNLKRREERNEKTWRLFGNIPLYDIVNDFNFFGVSLPFLPTGDATKTRKIVNG